MHRLLARRLRAHLRFEPRLSALRQDYTIPEIEQRVEEGRQRGQRGQLRRRNLGASGEGRCPSGLDPFDHPTTTVTKKTLLQAIEREPEQGQQVFFKIWVFEGKKGGRPDGRRPGRSPAPRLEISRAEKAGC